ncbi:GNAT family N-acetyltransferase [Variovorax sp. Root318D1]|uniref:GNAT family N-acetyltransferase n=1 Tax=Variovorax sp. Root318D1 TaxID=1736513 RepID=UPI00138F291F|nr:GNAT family N-acetyltransferase [Variovorax sp. Root318D1]
MQRVAAGDLVSLAKTGRPIDVVISPHFESHRDLKLGDERLKIVITEINKEADIVEFQRLEQFHYKGVNLDQADGQFDAPPKGVGGRRAILLASIVKQGLTRALGYIELQMPLLMCKPRHDVFSHPFAHAEADVAWNTWLGDGQKYVNRIARIARVVVDPEFRGIGASTLLVEAAKEFCRSRWHVSGQKPLFLEISAEMLRYVDFVTRAGFHYIGDTEGNLDRIAKDLHSIEKGAEGKSGIMSLQRKYHSAFVAYCQKTKKTFDEARVVLSELLKTQDPRSEMASDEWLAFRPIIRFPIPYFVVGLDKCADDYLKEAIAARGRGPAIEKNQGALRIASGIKEGRMISFEEVEVFVDYEIPLTQYVRLIMDSFGIEARRVRSRIVGPVDIAAQRGQLLLITGASGAGKSVLLNALSDQPMGKGLIRKRSKSSAKPRTATLCPLPEGIPIFQYFAQKYGTSRAFAALCQVGLSEAMVFIKPYEVLSMGQRYRAMFAELTLSDAPVWLIDEFCSNLDPITSKILAIRIKRLATKNDRVVVVAAANTEHFIEALSPDQILLVRNGAVVSKLTKSEYLNGFFNKGF